MELSIVLNIKIALCFFRRIERLSQPSLLTRSLELSSYVDLVITLAALFYNFCYLSFNVIVSSSETEL